jgi:hypothetical protein
VSGERKTKIGARNRGLLRFRLSVICSLSSLLLSGCLDSAVEMGGPPAKLAAARGGAGPQISPHGASLAVISIEGPPVELGAVFQKQFASAAQSRDIALAEADLANYRLRGFLTASPAQGATRLAYVLDVYDRRGRRVQRLTSEAGVKADADPWRAVDEKSLTIFAERGADDVAAFLSTTPEAIAAAGGEAGVSIVAVDRTPGAVAPSALAAVGDKR